MSDIDRIREQIRRDVDALDSGADAAMGAAEDELDEWLTALSDDLVPSQITIDLLLDNSPVVDMPVAWRDRALDRWAIVAAQLDRRTPRLAELLADARKRANVAPQDAATILGWDTAAYQRLEEGRSAGALMNAPVDRLRGLSARLGISPAVLVSAVSMAVMEASGLGFGHRPRTTESEAVAIDTGRDRERLNEWARSVLVGEG